MMNPMLRSSAQSLGIIKMGPERGKHVLDVDKCRRAAQENRERREAMQMKDIDIAKTKVTEEDMQKHPDLRPIVASTSRLHESIASGEWDVECFIAKEKLANTLGSSFPTLLLGDSIKGDPHSRTLASLPATKPDVLSALLQESGFDSRALPLSNSIKAASGRYRPDHGIHYKTPRRRLKELTSKTFDQYLKEEAPPTTLVVVACLAGWLPQVRLPASPGGLLACTNSHCHSSGVLLSLPACTSVATNCSPNIRPAYSPEVSPARMSVLCLRQCRRVEANLEMLNGQLFAKEGASTRAYLESIAAETGSGVGPKGAGAPSSVPEFLLRKFDFSNSRMLNLRYNINTLPMYLMYYGGRLVFASNSLNGFGSSTDDLLAQVAMPWIASAITSLSCTDATPCHVARTVSSSPPAMLAAGA